MVRKRELAAMVERRDERIAGLEAQVAELFAALAALVERHGWTPGAGPCVCAAHEDARALLAKVGRSRG